MFRSTYKSLRYNFEEQYETSFLKLKHGDLFHSVLPSGEQVHWPPRRSGNMETSGSNNSSQDLPPPELHRTAAHARFYFYFYLRGRVQLRPLFSYAPAAYHAEPGQAAGVSAACCHVAIMPFNHTEVK